MHFDVFRLARFAAFGCRSDWTIGVPTTALTAEAATKVLPARPRAALPIAGTLTDCPISAA
jgi:hypothetical protein